MDEALSFGMSMVWSLDFQGKGHRHIYIRTYRHTYRYTYLRTCIHAYIPTYIHTYLHTYIPTYIHTYTAGAFRDNFRLGKCSDFMDRSPHFSKYLVGGPSLVDNINDYCNTNNTSVWLGSTARCPRWQKFKSKVHDLLRQDSNAGMCHRPGDFIGLTLWWTNIAI